MAVDICSRSYALLIRSWQRASERHHRCGLKVRTFDRGPKVRTFDCGHWQFVFRIRLTSANSLAQSHIRRWQRVDFSSCSGHRQPRPDPATSTADTRTIRCGSLMWLQQKLPFSSSVFSKETVFQNGSFERSEKTKKRGARNGKDGVDLDSTSCVVGKRVSMVLHSCLAAAGQLHELATRWAQP